MTDGRQKKTWLHDKFTALSLAAFLRCCSVDIVSCCPSVLPSCSLAFSPSCCRAALLFCPPTALSCSSFDLLLCCPSALAPSGLSTPQLFCRPHCAAVTDFLTDIHKRDFAACPRQLSVGPPGARDAFDVCAVRTLPSRFYDNCLDETSVR